MPLAHTGELMRDAVGSGVGLAAFNVISLEHGEAIIEAAEQTQLPAVLQISENCIKFHHGRLKPLVSGLAALAESSHACVSLHLDHIEDERILREAAGTAITSVMFDGSRLGFQDNVAATRDAARWAHLRGWHVEAELGEIGGKNGAHAPGVRTDPVEAARFAADTGVDSLAVAVGSSHAMTAQTARLDHDLIARIRAVVGVPLVLHGSSGVPDDEVVLAVASGMVKINLGTILNVAFTGAVRSALAAPDIVDPRAYLAPARMETAAVACRLLQVVATRPVAAP
ncbi:class II fructose-bisphosphate aldolase [Arthrobacter globiformis]|uniref:class II fructose-bisphosphate aldolase n=1 Tax=Arthrobacter globiformis TaxID=1665 RepID=UPI00278771A1|nr:class II fructose-bisphosphate aldolase [Arthrobacter globiformis]MDQ0867055.1 fructose-bisphosphate aldolase class II [Arthrobacter globiformis]